MVGLQAMVLGRMGRSPPLIQERVLYPAHRHLRAGAAGALAFIMLVLLAALFFLPGTQRGLHFGPLLACPRFSYPTSSVALEFTPVKRCARASVVRSCPSPVGWARLFLKRSNNFLLFAAPASLIGSELPPPTGLRPFAVPRPDAARLACPDLRRG